MRRREIRTTDSGFRSAVLAVAALAAAAVPCRAQEWDTSAVRAIAPGVTHKRLVSNAGPWRINVLEIDLRQPGLIIRGVRARDSAQAREKVSSMVARYNGPGRAVAGINADFFNTRTFESENNVVVEGRIEKGITITDSPHESFDNVHYQFGVDWNNRPFIERFTVAATLRAPGRRPIRLEGINSWPDSNTLVLYTRVYGAATPPDTAGRRPTLVPLRLRPQRGDTMVFTIAGKTSEGGSLPLESGGVLAAGGDMRQMLRSIGRRGGTVRIAARIQPAPSRLRTVVGGWPRVVMNGRSIAEYSSILEGTFPRFEGRHPRSGVGISRDSSTLFLITVDGRRPTDAGMSLVELATLMLRLGVHDGMNFDGGGSTTMVVEGKVVNLPSDRNGEREVGSGLLVVVGAEK